jgi:hypothetical protein
MNELFINIEQVCFHGRIIGLRTFVDGYYSMNSDGIV